MKPALRAGAGAVAAALSACGGGGGDPDLFEPPPPPVALTQVSGLTPFESGCDQQAPTGTNYRSSEVEPYLAVNPTDPDNLIGTWQQDRWSNGGARGLLAGVSFDGGATWTIRQAPFSRCSGGNVVNGGDWARATDPWITFGPDGVAYWMAMNITGGFSGMSVSRSFDGGDTWDAPVYLISSSGALFNDKNSITADPTDASHVYATWDQLDSSTNSGPAVFTRTTDGGDSWEAVREIWDPGFGAQTVGNVIVVLPDGTVVNLFTEIHFASAQPDGATLRVIRSTDRGATWSAPITVAEMLTVGAEDPESGIPVRSGGILGSIAVAPGGDLWLTWQDSRFSGVPCCVTPQNPPAPVDSIVLARSTDGGLTWGAPVLVPADPQVQAFTPTVHVADDGTIGVTYYDFRDDPGNDGYALTSYWLATSEDDGVTWTERRISGPFDLRIAPNALGLFVGDYEGLRSSGSNFVPFFAQTFPDLGDRTNVYAVSLPTVAPAIAKAQASHAAYAGPPMQITAAHWERVRQNVEFRRPHFDDRTQPWFLPRYLRNN
jgi:hypothetical protein